MGLFVCVEGGGGEGRRGDGEGGGGFGRVPAHAVVTMVHGEVKEVGVRVGARLYLM